METKLDAVLVNAFLNASTYVISSFLGEQPERGEMSAEPTATTTNQVNVVLKVTGDIQGHVILGMSLATADRIASVMIGQPVKTFDAIASSAVSELGLMICENGILKLPEMGYRCELTPPSVIKGLNVQIRASSVPAILIPLQISHGMVSLTVALAPAKVPAVA